MESIGTIESGSIDYSDSCDSLFRKLLFPKAEEHLQPIGSFLKEARYSRVMFSIDPDSSPEVSGFRIGAIVVSPSVRR